MIPQRVRWPDQGGFAMAAIGAAIGMGCLTGFPGAVLAHGGGAFLVAFLVATATAAVPMLSVEFGLGLCYQGSLAEGLRKTDRRLEWLGWWSIALGMLAALLGCALVAATLVYAYDCLLSLVGDRPLPWGGSAQAAERWMRSALEGGASDAQPPPDLGTVRPVGSVLLALAVAWLLVWATVRGGVARIGGLCQVSVPVSVALLALFAVAMMLQPGAIDGVARYLAPDWSHLLRLDTWAVAYGQVFQCLSLGLGVFVAYGSYLNRNADATGSAAITALAGAGFAFVSGLVAAAAAGVLAAASGLPLSALPLDDAQAAFVVHPAAIAQLDLSVRVQSLLALLFFATLALLAFDTVIGLVAASVTALVDKFHADWRRCSAGLCVAGFFVAAPFATSSGPLLGEVLVGFLIPGGVAIAAALQCLALAMGSGSGGLERHLNAYSVIPVGGAWRIMVAAVIPAALATLAIHHLVALLRAGSPHSIGVLVWAGAVPCAVALAAGVAVAWLPGRRLP